MAVGVNRNRTQTAGTAPIGGGKRRKIPKHNSVGTAHYAIGSHKKIGSMHQMHIGDV